MKNLPREKRGLGKKGGTRMKLKYLALFSVLFLGLFATLAFAHEEDGDSGTAGLQIGEVAKERLEGTREVAQEKREAAREIASADTARGKLQEAREGAREIAREKAERAREVARERREALREKVSEKRETIRELAADRKELLKNRVKLIEDERKLIKDRALAINAIKAKYNDLRKLNAADKKLFRDHVFARLSAEFNKRIRALDALEVRATAADSTEALSLISETRAYLEQKRDEFKATNDTAVRKQIVIDVNKKWNEFKRDIAKLLLKRHIDAGVQKALDALNRLDGVIANMSAKGYDTTRLEQFSTIIENRINSVTEAADNGSIKLATWRLAHLRGLLGKLKAAIHRVLNGQEVELPEEENEPPSESAIDDEGDDISEATPTPVPTVAPTATPAPTAAATPEATATPTLEATATPTASPTETPTPTPEPTETPAPTETPTPTAAPTETPTPTAEPTASPSPTA